MRVEWIHWSDAPGRYLRTGARIGGVARYAGYLPYLAIDGGDIVTVESSDGRVLVLTVDSNRPNPMSGLNDPVRAEIVNGDGWDDDGW